jgi:hypothetical protein
MNIFISSVPFWVSILLVLCIPIPILLTANLAKQSALNANWGILKANRTFLLVATFLFVYIIYVSLMSYAGIFQENVLPPKILLFTGIPLMLFLLIVLPNLPSFQKLLPHVPIQGLIQIHVFRLIGSFFILLNIYGAIPTKFAYVGGIGDIVVAISSIFVANAVKQNKSYARGLVIGWNILGLLDIVVTVANALIATKASIETGSQSVIAITYFPFCFIPAFAPAVIIFLHVILFRRLFDKKLQ